MSDGRTHRLLPAAAWLLTGAGVLVATFAVLLAMPIEEWRTGERFENTLPTLPAAALPRPAVRVWIDSDPGCGAGARVDADDCLAILYLGLRGDIEIAGVSTVFGNASLDVTDETARELSELLARQGAPGLQVYSGAAEALGRDMAAPPTDAERGLIDALSGGPLVLLALGPLTNVAAALAARPDLQDRVERIVAVMGRRPGHLFHPSEGSGRGVLFGHGPIFRDFNVAMDPLAVATLIGMDVPLALVPYEAAREVEIDGADLDAIAVVGPAGRWVADRARPWLDFWNTRVGRSGFYLFDLVAAVFVVEPQRFACAKVAVELRRDRTVHPPFSRRPALLVEELDSEAGPQAPAALYCHGLRAGGQGWRGLPAVGEQQSEVRFPSGDAHELDPPASDGRDLTGRLRRARSGARRHAGGAEGCLPWSGEGLPHRR